MPSDQATAAARHQPAQDVLHPADSYLAEVLSVTRPLPPRPFGLDDADGTVLAEDVLASSALPSFSNSAMDGYAVRARDTAAATPMTLVTLPVEAELAAGDTHQRELAARTCMRIMTGALLPAGADAVVRVEWTDGRSDQVTISRVVCPGTAVRDRSSDARPGLLLAAGTRLGPAQLALLAAAGQDIVMARARPRLTILSAGDELAGPGTPLIPGQTRESNSFMLAAAARQAGCVPRRYRVIRDDQDDLLAVVRDASTTTDLLVTSGGISMGGRHDSIKAAMQNLRTVAFRKVAMQPGMPQGVGTLGHQATPILMLPGNPVSAFVSFWLFALPAVRALQRLARDKPGAGRAVLTAPVRSPGGKRSIITGVYDRRRGTVTPASGHTCHHLTALARADALIIVPEQITILAAGDAVDVLDLPA